MSAKNYRKDDKPERNRGISLRLCGKKIDAVKTPYSKIGVRAVI